MEVQGETKQHKKNMLRNEEIKTEKERHGKVCEVRISLNLFNTDYLLTSETQSTVFQLIIEHNEQELLLIIPSPSCSNIKSEFTCMVKCPPMTVKEV